LKEAIPPEVLSIIDQHIESVEHLEILLLLFQSEQGCAISEINQRIQSSAGSIELRLKQFEKGGFVFKDSSSRFCFKCDDEVRRKIVTQLCECYRAMPVRVIEAIYARKTDAVQTFADAFKFKK
jgi:hypothetical protein